jgi:uncharacterized protein (DUF362 family)
MIEITRRDFLRMGVGLSVATLLPKSLLSAEEKEVERSLIGVARGEKSGLVRAATDLVGGLEGFVKPGDKVCIKPNISFAANLRYGATTSPEITRQVVELCLDAGASKVVILDHTIQDPALCVEKNGTAAAIVDKSKVDLLTLTRERQFFEVDVPQGKELQSVKIAKVLKQSDKLINLPTAKSHSATGVSLGMKNLMGLIWDRGHLHHRDLHKAIAELATVIKPDLTIIDATRALTSGGPGGPGKTVELNTVVAGHDMVAVDSYTVGITQWYNKSFTGGNVRYIAAASELGLGQIETDMMRIEEVNVSGTQE